MNRRVEMALLVGLFVVMSVTLTGAQQAEVVVFIGHPKVKVEVPGLSFILSDLDIPVEKVSAEKVSEFACVIVKKGDTYYWKSRENRKLIPAHADGAYFTFYLPNRPDYVRIANPTMRELLSAVTGVPFDYVEHLTIGLSSINYYGKATIDLPPSQFIEGDKDGR